MASLDYIPAQHVSLKPEPLGSGSFGLAFAATLHLDGNRIVEVREAPCLLPHRWLWHDHDGCSCMGRHK